MKTNIFTRAKDAWNVFRGKGISNVYGGGSYDPNRYKLSQRNERTIIASIYTRLALDVAAIDIKHVRLNDKNRYMDTIDSGLNKCFNLEANLDQSCVEFKKDLVLSMLDEGCVAVVPTIIDQESRDFSKVNAYQIMEMRIGKVVEWFPNAVRVSLYNQDTGLKEEVLVSKSGVAIIENPFYSVMNESNSTMQRLLRKLSLLDVIDERVGAGKLDIIIQLPYAAKSEYKESQAEKRRMALESQLKDSAYGIGYIDSTEHITQLNRPAENNLMAQIEYLTSMLFSQLGITKAILDGTASESEMVNYNKRTVEPIITAIVSELNRKFITPTGRAQKQAIMFFNDPFKVVTATQIPELADKLTRNEIMTSNEIRQIIGIQPSEDPGADKLRNKNLNQNETAGQTADTPIDNYDDEIEEPDDSEDDGELLQSILSDLENKINEIVDEYAGADESEADTSVDDEEIDDSEDDEELMQSILSGLENKINSIVDEYIGSDKGETDGR